MQTESILNWCKKHPGYLVPFLPLLVILAMWRGLVQAVEILLEDLF